MEWIRCAGATAEDAKGPLTKAIPDGFFLGSVLGVGVESGGGLCSGGEKEKRSCGPG